MPDSQDGEERTGREDQHVIGVEFRRDGSTPQEAGDHVDLVLQQRDDLTLRQARL